MKKLALLSTLLLAGAAFAASPADTLVIQSSADLPTFDPESAYDSASYAITSNLYETLIAYKGNSLTQFEPLLATKWAISNGGKTFTFDLRKNVKFHDGSTFTCADAEYTFRRNLVINGAESGQWYMSDPLLGVNGAASDYKDVTFDKIANAVKCNAAGQLVFTLVKTDPSFLAKLAAYNEAIVSKSYTSKLDWDGTEAGMKKWAGQDMSGSDLSNKPNGTGAYKLVKKDATTVLFTAHDGYWGKKSNIKNVIQQKVPELAARQQAFLRGDADFIDGAGRAVDEAQVKGKPGVTWVDDLPNNVSTAFFMNQNIKSGTLLGSGKLDGKGIPANFFSDVNVRRGFSYAFDYQGYINDVLKGKGMQRTMLLPDMFPGYDPKVKKYTFDPKKATTYFKQAWGGNLWKNGFVMTVNYRAGSVPAQTAMEMLKKNVEALNPKFKINIQPKQWSEMLSSSKAGGEAMIVIGWLPDYADPSNFIDTFYASDGFYSPRSNFKDASIDKWIQQTHEETNVAKRNKLYSLIGNRAYEQAYYIIYPAGVGYNFYSSRISAPFLTKAGNNPMTNLQWKDVTKK